MATAQASQTGQSFGRRIRHETAAVRVRKSQFGAKKALEKGQRNKAAESFSADGEYLSAGKKLLDTRDPAYRQVTSTIRNAVQYWRACTVPYPVEGVRLIRRDRIDEFDARMTEFQAELADAVDRLDDKYSGLRDRARTRLGDLYNPNDYPPSLVDEFSLGWEYPSVDPPDYLKELNPKLWEQEQERIAERFDAAVRMAEEAFTEELARMTAHLADRLSGDDDGKPKVLRASAVENMREFFDRFRSLNVRSNDALDQLVNQAEQALDGIDTRQLRRDGDLRSQIGGTMAAIREQLDAMTVSRPSRAIALPDEESADEGDEATRTTDESSESTEGTDG